MIRVLSIVSDGTGGWHVDLDSEDPAELARPADPAKVRLLVVDESHANLAVDLPDETLRAIARRIGEL